MSRQGQNVGRKRQTILHIARVVDGISRESLGGNYFLPIFRLQSLKHYFHNILIRKERLFKLLLLFQFKFKNQIALIYNYMPINYKQTIDNAPLLIKNCQYLLFHPFFNISQKNFVIYNLYYRRR
jgi:hypothetical protein